MRENEGSVYVIALPLMTEQALGLKRNLDELCEEASKGPDALYQAGAEEAAGTVAPDHVNDDVPIQRQVVVHATATAAGLVLAPV